MEPDYSIQPIPSPGRPDPAYMPTVTQGEPQPWYSGMMNWLKSNPRLAMLFAQNPILGAAYGVGKTVLPWLGDHAVPTPGEQTIGNMDWMGGNPSDPFGYVGQAYEPVGNAIEDRIAGNIENNLRGGGQVPRSWDGSGAQQAGSYGSFGPGGMSSYLLPVAGGGPSIPVIEGPKYTGAPYNPYAFADWVQNGDRSWWDKYQSAPWQQGGPGSSPMDAIPQPVPGPGVRDPSTRIPGQRNNTLFNERTDGALDPIEGGGGGYGTGPDWSGVYVNYYY